MGVAALPVFCVGCVGAARSLFGGKGDGARHDTISNLRALSKKECL